MLRKISKNIEGYTRLTSKLASRYFWYDPAYFPIQMGCEVRSPEAAAAAVRTFQLSQQLARESKPMRKHGRERE